MDVVDRFYDAMNRKDMVAFAATIHPDFEMIVPQKPARGFKGKAQEVNNIAALCENHKDLVMTVLRKVRDGNEVWTEAYLKASNLEMAAVTIWTIDPKTDTLISGRYYSEPVQRDAPDINTFMKSLGAPSHA
jgi:ketosteroid isomerase-like protein